MYYVTVMNAGPIPQEAPLWELLQEDLSYTIGSDLPLVVQCPTLRSAWGFIGAAQRTASVCGIEMSRRRPAQPIAMAARVTGEGTPQVRTVEDRFGSMQEKAVQMQHTFQTW